MLLQRIWNFNVLKITPSQGYTQLKLRPISVEGACWIIVPLTPYTVQVSMVKQVPMVRAREHSWAIANANATDTPVICEIRPAVCI